MKASIHPPNELSVPRCYPEPTQINTPTINSPGSLPYSPNIRRQPTKQQSHEAPKYNSLQSVHSTSSSPSRPRLRRESAQDMDDSDINPNINIELAEQETNNFLAVTSRRYFRLGVSSFSQSSRSRSSLNQRSAPGTPMNHCVGKYSRSPSRTPSDESGHLQVPFSRSRGSSLPDGMEDSIMKNNSYLLRQFNIRGRKVVHLGDSYHQRATSTSSIHSNSIHSNLSIG